MSKQIHINAQLVIKSKDQTILQAMEDAGLEAEYHCRDGHCGACRCKLKKGQVEEVGFAMAYKHSDEILPCISKARSDIELEGVKYKHNELV